MNESAYVNTKQTGLLTDHSGKYRWIYEMPMMKSFFLLFEVWKAIGMTAFIVFLLLLVIGLITGGGTAGIIGSLQMSLLVLGIFLVLSLPAYYIVTKANNNMYTVLFEMDDSGIDHIQIKTEKARALEALTVFVGKQTGNRTTTAAGLLSASGSSLYSRFEKVKKIKAVREKNLIILNGRLIRNQVYVDDENFDFVYTYIKDHCPNAVTD